MRQLKKSIKKAVSILLIMTVIVSLFTATPFAAGAAASMEYLCRRWDSDAGKTVESILTQSSWIDIRDRTSNHLQSGAWYAVTTNTTISDRLYVDSGTVRIILCDGATLTDRKGIGVSASATLEIYGQQNDTGKMYMHFDTDSYEMEGDYAVIGADSGDTGTINIYGGTLDLDSCYFSKGAVIGGGKGGAPYSVNIYGGTITCNSREGGAGIGGGYQGAVSRSGSDGVHIYGGTVTVRSWSSGAGIGSGANASSANGVIDIYNGKIESSGYNGGAGVGGGLGAGNPTINIYDGDITACGTKSSHTGAGIGSGGNANQNHTINIQGGIVVSTGQSGAGIGAGTSGSAGTINITGGDIVASSTAAGAGIGGGSGGSGGTITIKNSKVTATSSKYGEAEEFSGALMRYMEGMDLGVEDQSYATTAIGIIAGLIDLFDDDYSGAGIGGGNNGGVSTITIKDSTVTAESGKYAAAIGGGKNNSFGTITIDKSTVTATSGDYGAGIGSGDEASSGGGTINILNHSTVTAKAGTDAAGIGTGNECGSPCSAINITDSNVTAHGGSYGAAIGGGDDVSGGNITINNSTVEADRNPRKVELPTGAGGHTVTVTVRNSDGAGIGGGESGHGGNITITNHSKVTAHGGSYAAGIGGGDGGDGGTVYVSESTVDAFGGTDAAGIGGGEDGKGCHIEIYSSVVYAEGKSYGAGIGGGEDSSGDYCGIFGSSTVTAVSGGDGNAQSIGHGDCGWYISDYTGGTLYLYEQLLVDAGRNKNSTSRYTAQSRFDAIWDHDYARIYRCDHADTCWRYEPGSVYHYVYCRVCQSDVRHEAHTWDENYICTKCNGKAELFTDTFVEKNNDGEVTSTLELPAATYFTMPECTQAPDGYEFVCWSNGGFEFYKPGDLVYTMERDEEYRAVYLPVVETTYVTENGEEKTVTARKLSSMGISMYLSEGWYVIEDDINIAEIVTYEGNVKLILSDSATLSFSQYLSESEHCLAPAQGGYNTGSFTIYGQSRQTGKVDFGVRKPYFYNLVVCGGNVSFSNPDYPDRGQIVVFNDCSILKGTVSGDRIECQHLAIYGGNAAIGFVISPNTTLLGWTEPTDSITINEFYEKSVLINGDQQLTDSTEIYTGALTEAEASAIRGKTLTPNIHDYVFSEWVWSDCYTHAKAVFICNDCGKTAEVNAKVFYKDNARERVVEARCRFLGRNYIVNKAFTILFDVNIAPASHGSVAVGYSPARLNDRVDVTVTPDEGYVTASFSVTDEDGNKVETDGYSFIMPESAVTVKATFAHLVEARDAYTDSSGEYFPGLIAHYTDGERYYAVKEDGSIGQELSDVEVSDYEFRLQEDGTYQLAYYKGSALGGTFTIPKLYHGKKITTLGNDDRMRLFTGSQTQFELVLNENIREIKPFAFYSMYVTKVSGDTSALSAIGASAFSGVNYPGGNTLDMTLLYPGTVTVEKDTFRDLSVTVHLTHSTVFSRSDLILQDVVYDFTDDHPYGDPVWSWADDHSAATATFACSDPRCDDSHTLTAAVSVTETREKSTYTASVSFNGETYTDLKEILNTAYTVTIASAEHGTVTADAASAYAGETVTLSAAPDTGCVFEGYTVTAAGGEAVEVSGNKFTMPAGDVTVSAAFRQIDYTVTYAETENGTVTGAAAAHCGEVVTLTPKPDKDSYLVSLSVTDANGEMIEVTDQKFTMPAQNVTVTAVFSLIESNQCGPDLYWKLDKSTETLTIYGTGEMFDYNNDQAIRAPWYRSFSYISSIVIEDGATSIGSWAFAYCTATDVSIPATVASIGSNAFQDTMMHDVRLPDSITAIGRAAFRDCSYLDGLTIPAGVISIGEDAFKGVGNLFDVYCYADPAALAWDDGYYDDFLPNKMTTIHVAGDRLRAYTSKFGSKVYANFVGDLVDYTITTEECDHGIVTADYAAIHPNAVVTLTAAAEEGYALKTLTVTKADGSNIPVNDGKFVMPAQNVTVSAVFDFPDGLGAKIAGYSLSLEGDIAVNFYTVLSDTVIAHKDTAYMHFTIPTGTGTTDQSMLVKDARVVKSGNKTYYVFKCRVAAKEMTSEIKAQMIDGDMTGTEYAYSVKEYADYLLSHASGNAEYTKAVPLVKRMLNYGAFAQIFFDKNPGTLANADLTTADKALGDPEINIADPDLSKLPEGVTFEGATLSLKSETTLSLYFKSSNTLEFSCDGYTVEKATAGGCQIARIRGIRAKHIGDILTLKIGGNEAISYSPLNYCRTVLDGGTDNENLQNVIKALYAYWQAAYPYFES